MIRWMRFSTTTTVVAAALIVCASTVAWAVPFQIGFNSGDPLNTNHLYAQGFSPAVRANPDPFTDPMLGVDDIVHLNQFTFFKANYFFEDPPDSGTFVPLVATNFQLAIVDNFFLNLDTFTTASPELIGLSTNTIATTATIATGDPINFMFDGLELSYGAIDYAAIFVRNDGAGNLAVVDTPVLVATYAEETPGSGFVPTVDYGDPAADFLYACSNFITVDEFGSFLRAFDPPYGDARFIAYFNQEAAEGLPGDYNGDDVVDAADYTVWRNNLNTSFNLNGNGDENGASAGIVDAADYLWWRRHYGTQLMLGGGGTAAVVPEPGCLAIFIVTIMFWGASGRRRG